jgi:hypothetical protein
MLDTLRIMLVEGQTLLRVKALRLKLAVISLSVSAVLTGLNITTGG